MKSRVAVMMVLALGVFMSGTGATLAVSGLAGTGSASSVQYPDNTNAHQNTLAKNCAEGVNTVTGERCNSAEPVADTQAVRQVASSGSGSLPFTGFLAIPVLIVGVGLLGAGVAMRLRMRSGDHAA